MKSSNVVRSSVATVAITAGLWLGTPYGFAQTVPTLPTAPGADRSVGPAVPTAAKASLPGDNGSPLEPYLFTFLLAGGGLIAALAARLADSRVKRDFASFGMTARSTRERQLLREHSTI